MHQKETEIKKLRPAVYLRVSTEDQVEKYGLELQEVAIKNFINNRYDYLDFSHAKIYVDEAKSGTLRINERNGLKQLFDDIKYSSTGEPPFDVVVVYKIDRFARDLKVLLDIVEELEDNSVSFASTQEMIDTSTPFGKAMLGILGVFAELDRDMIIQKTHAGIDRALLHGVWYKDKFGYTRNREKKPVINKEQAEVVKRIFYMFSELQYPISKICDIFQKEKIMIPTAWNTQNLVKKQVSGIYNWTDKTVRQILADETYIGNYYYNRQVSVKDKISGKKIIKYLPKEEWQLSPVKHNPIIDQMTFDKVQGLLGDKKGNFQRTNDYVLGGLIKCDYCKGDKARGMVSWTGISANGGKYYQCGGKKTQKYSNPCCTIPLPKQELENIVKAKIKEIILNPEVLKKHIENNKGSRDGQARIQKEIQKINLLIERLFENIASLEELFTTGKSGQTTKEYLDTRKRISDSIDENIKERANLEMRLSKSVEEEKQILAINYLKQIIGNLEEVFENDQKCKELFNVLIDTIVIYSEVDKNVQITGRKKQGEKEQALPKGIVINFKLPQVFLNDVFMGGSIKNKLLDNRQNNAS